MTPPIYESNLGGLLDEELFDEADFYASEGGEDDSYIEDVEVDVDDVGGDEDPAPTVPDDAPVEDGQGEAENNTPEREYLDLNQFEGKFLKIKVQGEEIDVPVTDLPNGYQRQADYTQKTQEVAQQREQLAFWAQVDQAMRVNPQETISYLAQQYGADVAAQAQDRADGEDDWSFEDEAPQPLDPRVDQLTQQLNPVVEFVQQQMAARELETVVRDLSTKYGEEFNPSEVIAEADRRQVYDPHQLESVFRDMSFEKYRALASAQQTLTQQQQQTQAQRQAAAAAAGRVIGNVPSSSGGREAVQPAPVFNTPGEAARAAIRELMAQQ